MGLIEAGLLSVYTDPYTGAQSLSLADGVPGNNAFVVTATGNAGDFMLTLNTYHRGYAEAWSELAGPLQVVLTGVAILGYLACPFTGVGCAVGAAASSGAAGLGVVSTVMACGAEVASLDCGVAALGTAIDAATFGAGVFARARWATGATRAGNSAIDYGRALTVPGSSDALALYVEERSWSSGSARSQRGMATRLGSRRRRGSSGWEDDRPCGSRRDRSLDCSGGPFVVWATGSALEGRCNVGGFADLCVCVGLGLPVRGGPGRLGGAGAQVTASRSPAQLSSPEGRRTGQGFALFGSGFLNNRYHDPMLAAFISVDPLVGKTGDPYLYSSGSPITLSDPSGLDDEFNLIGALGEWVVEQQQNEIAHNCIKSESCDGQELVDAIDETMDDGLGGLIYGTIDVANQGDWDKLDGNWNPNDFRAAAEGEHVIQLLLDLGFEPHVAYELANLIMSVAQRLQDDNDIYEDIDEEQSWWERNADTVMKVVGVISLVAGIVSLGQCLYCSYFGVVSLIGSAATTGYACSQGDKTGCALGVVSRLSAFQGWIVGRRVQSGLPA